jgi:hypothetical protein
MPEEGLRMDERKPYQKPELVDLGFEKSASGDTEACIIWGGSASSPCIIGGSAH